MNFLDMARETALRCKEMGGKDSLIKGSGSISAESSDQELPSYPIVVINHNYAQTLPQVEKAIMILAV